MLKDEPCGVVVIEDDVGDVGDVLMAGDGNGRNIVLLVKGGVNGNDALDAAREKQLGIRAHEFVVMAVYDGIWVGEGSRIPNVNGLRKQLVDALKRVQPGMIRWPGGCFAAQVDWGSEEHT